MLPRIRIFFASAVVLALLSGGGCQKDPLGLDPVLQAPLGDNKPPVVAITAPADGDTVTGLVIIAAAATDRNGVDSVEFFLDGSKLADATDTTEPFEYEWDTRSVPGDSGYALTARATDPSGNSALSDPVNVIVVNPVVPEKMNVIVLLIDGARYTETFGDPSHANVPFLWNVLRPQGTVFSNFRNEGWTRTVPGHASVESGTWQYIANDGTLRPTRPTFFEYWRSEQPVAENETYVVAGKLKLEVCSYSTHPDYGAAYGAAVDAADRDDIPTFQALVGRLQAEHPRLVLANFARVDRAAHTGIWNDYIEAIQTADSLVYELWQFIESDQFYAGKTYLLVTNDHGRHTTDFTNHGDGCEGCTHLMCLMLGPDIKRNYTIADAHTMLELCPTIGSILDFSTPYVAGLPLTDIFTTPASGIAAVSR